jgi:hypothetical protein
MKQIRNDVPIVLGNQKLPKTTAILNVCPAGLCPSRLLGLCQLKNPDKACYALREERTWKNTCLPSRFAMMCYWDHNDAWSIARDLIAFNGSKKTKLAALRLNECGDWRHQADVDKAEMLARYLAKADIVTYCYTARSDLDYMECKHLVVNGSGWDAHNRFQAAYDLDETTMTCTDKKGNQVKLDSLCPGDCRICTKCLHRTGKVVGVKLH